MEYFTERHNLRKTMDFSGEIKESDYKRLFSCCKNYFFNLAWKFPLLTDVEEKYCGYNETKLIERITIDIPELLYLGSDGDLKLLKETSLNTLSVLDFIEFCAETMRDISGVQVERGWGKVFFLEYTDNVFNEFQEEINNTFHRLGLLYILSDKKRVERVPVNTPLSMEIEESISEITEKGLKDLLEESVELFKSPKPENQKLAVEKIWDALERLKTYYTDLDKKNSAIKLVDKMSNSEENFKNVFNDEFSALTKIGNNFRIRHHETDKIDITDPRHFDYFFNRCLSLIALAIPYLEE